MNREPWENLKTRVYNRIAICWAKRFLDFDKITRLYITPHAPQYIVNKDVVTRIYDLLTSMARFDFLNPELPFGAKLGSTTGAILYGNTLDEMY